MIRHKDLELLELRCSIDNKVLGEVSKDFVGDVFRICPDCKTKQRFSYQTYEEGGMSILGVPVQMTRVITVSTMPMPPRQGFISKMVKK